MRDKLDEILAEVKKQDKKKSGLTKLLAVVGIITVAALLAYAIYKFFTPDYLEDFEDDFEDDFDDYFEDEDEAPEEEAAEEEAVEEAASEETAEEASEE